MYIYKIALITTLITLTGIGMYASRQKRSFNFDYNLGPDTRPNQFSFTHETYNNPVYDRDEA
jgi:hypothetical protein